jgi:hypothetical protein
MAGERGRSLQNLLLRRINHDGLGGVRRLPRARLLRDFKRTDLMR